MASSPPTLPTDPPPPTNSNGACSDDGADPLAGALRPLPRLIWLFWAQGWNNATPALVQDAAYSWSLHNPTWRVVRLDQYNLTRFVNVSRLKLATLKWAAISDLLRLSLLADYGGVWADATLLCFQPLDGWADAAVERTGLFMYRGRKGPCSYFMLSKPHAYTVCAWRRRAEAYWRERDRLNVTRPGTTILQNRSVRLSGYFWLNGLFVAEHANAPNGTFARAWARVPYLWGPAPGSIDGQPLTTLDHPIGKKVTEVYMRGVPRALKLSIKRRCSSSSWGAASSSYHCDASTMSSWGPIKMNVAEWLVNLSLSGTARPAELPGSLDNRYKKGSGCGAAKDRLLCV